MNRKLIAKVLAGGLTTTAVLAAIVSGAGTASAATTAAGTSHAAATKAKPGNIAAPDEELTVGPILSAPTYQQCITYGASEFPIGSTYDGMPIVDMECLEGYPVPPNTGSWDLFLIVDAPECGAVAPTQAAEQASREVLPSGIC
ncbi:MAG: hypothetical protein ACRDP7_40520 [Trebonia sp.]